MSPQLATIKVHPLLQGYFSLEAATAPHPLAEFLQYQVNELMAGMPRQCVSGQQPLVVMSTVLVGSVAYANHHMQEYSSAIAAEKIAYKDKLFRDLVRGWVGALKPTPSWIGWNGAARSTSFDYCWQDAVVVVFSGPTRLATLSQACDAGLHVREQLAEFNVQHQLGWEEQLHPIICLAESALGLVECAAAGHECDDVVAHYSIMRKIVDEQPAQWDSYQQRGLQALMPQPLPRERYAA